MTENEAVKLMMNEIVCINTADHNECNRDCASCSLVKETDELLEAYNKAIQALEKVQQFESIGTIEEFKALKEKRKTGVVCPICGKLGTNRCEECGQDLTI